MKTIANFGRFHRSEIRLKHRHFFSLHNLIPIHSWSNLNNDSPKKNESGQKERIFDPKATNNSIRGMRNSPLIPSQFFWFVSVSLNWSIFLIWLEYTSKFGNPSTRMTMAYETKKYIHQHCWSGIHLNRIVTSIWYLKSFLKDST